MRLAVAVALALALGAVVGDAPTTERAEAGVPLFELSRIDLPYLGETGAIEMGPDGRLYVAIMHPPCCGPASILSITLDESGREAIAIEEIASDLRFVLGMAFDPLASPEAPILYVSHQDPTKYFFGATGYHGGVSRLFGPDWEAESVITGLPSDSGGLHYTNGLAFDAEGLLLIAQGSGAVDTPLAGATLVADVHDLSFDGTVMYDPLEFSEGVNANQVGGDVDVFAPGLRNPYGVVLHSNGRIYATDNGGGTADELNLIEEGLYYGHPNLNRARLDPAQETFRPPDEPSSGTYRAPIAVMPGGSACNGVAEYTSDAFGGQMTGDLLCAGYLFGALRRAVLSNDGTAVERVDVLTEGLGVSPSLDVAVRHDGTIYFGGGLAVLSPTSPAIPGDADCNDSVSPVDAALTLQTTAGLLAEPPCPYNADVNENGGADAVDAALVLQYAAGLLDRLPP